MPNDPLSEEPVASTDLAGRLRRGDPAAMQQVRERVRRIIGFRRLRIPRHEVEDLEQDVMTQVWRALNGPGFEFGGGVWGFVELVASRRCIDWLRTRRNLVTVSESLTDGTRDPLHTSLGHESRRIASEALAALDEPCRQLIALRISGGMTFKQLSATLGKSEESLRVQMYRCVRAARRIFGQRALKANPSEDARS